MQIGKDSFYCEWLGFDCTPPGCSVATRDECKKKHPLYQEAFTAGKQSGIANGEKLAQAVYEAFREAYPYPIGCLKGCPYFTIHGACPTDHRQCPAVKQIMEK